MEPGNSEKIDKRERIACLYLTFLNHPAGLSFSQIKKSLPLAYQGEPESARRKFERDKEDLKKLGLELLHHSEGRMSADGRDIMDHIYVPASEIHYLPELNFTVDEARALAAALFRSVRHLKSKNADTSLLESSSAKLFFNKPEALFIEEIYDQPRLDHEAGGDHNESEVLALIHESLRKKRVLRFAYDSSSGVKKRNVESRGLVAHRGRWCLVAFCRDSGDIRHFYLDRMHSAEMLSQEFKPDKNFHLNEYLLHPLNIRYHEKKRVKVYFSDNYEDAVNDYYMDIPSSLRPEKKEKYFAFETTNLNAVFSWVLKNRGAVISMEPEELKSQYNDFIRDIKEFYNDAK